MPLLTVSQLHKLKRILENRQNFLAQQVRINTDERTQQTYTSLAGDVTDKGDAASANAIIDTDYARIDMEMEELRDISAAQKRMDNLSYGVCTDCKVPIRYSRLHAYPTAKRCTICQENIEQSADSPKHASM